MKELTSKIAKLSTVSPTTTITVTVTMLPMVSVTANFILKCTSVGRGWKKIANVNNYQCRR